MTTSTDARPTGQEVLDGLVRLLDLEQLEVNLFRGVSPPHSPGRGCSAARWPAQALVAAGRTVPDDRAVHSLHAYFMRPGDPRIPIVYETERVRDGRSFTTRRVLAIQHGEPIFALSASFQIEQPGSSTASPGRSASRSAQTCPTSPSGSATPGRGSRCRPGPAAARHPVRHRADLGAALAGPMPAATPRLVPRRRHAAGRPAAARLHAHLRPTSPSWVRCSPATAWRRVAAADGDARPRDVVPPALPGRRLGALRHGLAVGVRFARAGPPATSSPPTAACWRRSSRRD